MRRRDGEPPRGPGSEPFEVTGAFALPTDSAGGPASAFPPPPPGDQAGPFEVTGAFVRPTDWDAPSPGTPTGPGAPASGPGFPGKPASGPGASGVGRPGDPASGPRSAGSGFPGDPAGPRGLGAGLPGDPAGAPRAPGGGGSFAGPATGDFDVPGPFDRTPGRGDGPRPGGGFFDAPAERTAAFPGPSAPHEAPSGDPFGPGSFGTPTGPGPFDRPGGTGPFDQATGTGPFGQSGGTGPFDQPPGAGPGSDPFGRPMRGEGFFDEQDGQAGGPADRTARFDAAPPAGPPMPGDIKVAGEPTAAVRTPAWAEAETGFLTSGWSADSGLDDLDDPEEPKGRRGRRRDSSNNEGGRGRGDDLAAPSSSGRGKGRVALLSVAAVAVVLGGTVAGVKLMSSDDPAKCEGATCAAVQKSPADPGPAVADPAVEDEESEPEEEPTADEEKTTPSGRPTPTASYVARAPRRTTSPTPKPTRTRVKASAQPTKQVTEEPTGAEESDTLTPNPNPEPSSDGGATEPPAQPTPVDTDRPGPFGQGGAAGSSINVRQTIKQRVGTYSASLKVANTSARALAAPTVSVPVEGKVLSVRGATWTQDGDLLILDVPSTLAAGDSAEVTFTATGTGERAETCGMVSGECSVT
ncbi:hypothetical protein SMD20_38140 [Nonomuraea sp. LP-02]|uniref:hypothetical protein n=1 Tax=Nonomuraea sp. LP-02 TaxID=3097960 RepID=UPI002E3310BC|nr:hypothetical protein [Nonomuraea sp. LP-02]MED7930104.1 hypothetical protein [Nonomuraea sp. LP-02]